MEIKKHSLDFKDFLDAGNLPLEESESERSKI